LLASDLLVVVVVVFVSRYRAVNTESKAFKAKLAPLVGPMAILKAVGFANGDDGKLHFEG
jgi:hypothetical protein